MKTLVSILKIYDINKVLVNNGETFDIIIKERKRSLDLNDWLNLNIALKRTYNKNVNYLNMEDALFIYKNDLSSFEEVSYE